MKKSLQILSLLPLLLTPMAARAQAAQVTLAWEVATNHFLPGSNPTLRLRSASDFTVPATNWPVLWVTNYTNPPSLPVTGADYAFRLTVTVPRSVNFFIVSVSNYWGELFSNITNTPPADPAKNLKTLKE